MNQYAADCDVQVGSKKEGGPPQASERMYGARPRVCTLAPQPPETRLVARTLMPEAKGLVTHIMCYAYYVSTNLTLTVDEALIREARKVALDRNSSVNKLVREYLEGLVKESGAQRAAMLELEELFREKPYTLGTKDWSRDDLYERGI